MVKLAIFVPGKPKKLVSSRCNWNGRTKRTSAFESFAGTQILGFTLAVAPSLTSLLTPCPSFQFYLDNAGHREGESPAVRSPSRADSQSSRNQSRSQIHFWTDCQEFWQLLCCFLFLLHWALDAVLDSRRFIR